MAKEQFEKRRFKGTLKVDVKTYNETLLQKTKDINKLKNVIKRISE